MTRGGWVVGQRKLKICDGNDQQIIIQIIKTFLKKQSHLAELIGHLLKKFTIIQSSFTLYYVFGILSEIR